MTRKAKKRTKRARKTAHPVKVEHVNYDDNYRADEEDECDADGSEGGGYSSNNEDTESLRQLGCFWTVKKAMLGQSSAMTMLCAYCLMHIRILAHDIRHVIQQLTHSIDDGLKGTNPGKFFVEIVRDGKEQALENRKPGHGPSMSSVSSASIMKKLVALVGSLLTSDSTEEINRMASGLVKRYDTLLFMMNKNISFFAGVLFSTTGSAALMGILVPIPLVGPMLATVAAVGLSIQTAHSATSKLSEMAAAVVTIAITDHSRAHITSFESRTSAMPVQSSSPLSQTLSEAQISNHRSEKGRAH